MKRLTSYGMIFALALGLGLALGLVWFLGITPGTAYAQPAGPQQLDAFWEEDFSAPISSATYYTTATSGSGSVDAGSFLLTQNAGDQRGRIFYLTSTLMTEFTTTFGLHLGSSDVPGADGAALIFCPSYDYAPDSGPSLDASCPGGYIVAFDTYEEIGGNGPDRVYVAQDDVNAGNRLVAADVANMEDGAWHTAGVDFRQGTITVTLDGSDVISGATLPGYTPFTGYFGFSGATSGQTNEQRVDDIQVHAPSLCGDTHVVSSQSTQTTGDLDDVWEYGGLQFTYVKVDVFSSDNDTLDATLSGYSLASGWEVIASLAGSGNATLYDDSLPPAYTQLRVQLDDTENNDTIYYNYEFHLTCLGPAVDLTPGEQQGFAGIGTTQIYTYTLTNYAARDAQFDLATSGNVWTTTLRDTGGAPISQTPVLFDLQSYVFAAWVDVPGGAALGETDTVTLTVSEVTSPSIQDTATLTTTALCADSLVFSGQSAQTTDDLDDVWEYLGQEFFYARVDIFSSDDDSMNASLSGYDPVGGWTILDSLIGSRNATLYDEFLVPPTYTQLRVQLDDTENNDTIYYNYEFRVCRKPLVDLAPEEQQGFTSLGTTQVYTHTLTNYAMRDAQFDLAASGGVWPTTLRDTDGAPINQTPALSDLEVYTFTVWVDVPGGAALGETDTVTLTASEVTSPSIRDTTTLTTTALCTNDLVFSGQSDRTRDDLDDVWDYGGQELFYASVDIWSEDNDTMNATLSGYNPGGGWTIIASLTDSDNATLYDGFFPPIYTRLRVQLDDTEDSDLIYYNYEFRICRKPWVGLLAPEEQRGIAGVGTTQIYTYTLTNYRMADAQFDLAASGNIWPTTIRDTGGAPLSQTPVLADLQTYTFTTWVDVPAGAALGDRDAVTLTSSVVISPSIQDTAALATLATSGQYGYVFDRNWNEINVLDTGVHMNTGVTIDTSPYGSGPLRGAISPDGRWLYAGLQYSDQVLVIDTATHAPVVSLTVGSEPHGIAFDASGAYAFVANQWDDTVSVIDTGIPTVTLTLPVGSRPMSIASSPCLDKVYVTTRDSDAISVIDVGTLTVTHVITGFNNPWDIVFASYGHRAYVSNQGSGSVGVIEVLGDRLVATWPIPSAEWITGLDLSPDGSRLYVTDAQAGVTYVVDTGSGQVVDSIFTSPSDSTWEVEVFPALAGPFAYVSNPWDADVKVINTDDNSLVRVIPLASEPRGLALFPPETVCPSAVRLEPSEATEFGAAGATVVYTETLYNLTGASDDFTLVTVGENWTTTLSILSTGLIADRTAVSVTVQVDIPPGVNAGDSDKLTLIATSVNAPTIYSDTTELTTRVMRPGYVFNDSLNRINVVDTTSHQDTGLFIDTSPYGSSPWHGELSPDGQWLYASLRDSSRVLVISTTNTLSVTSLAVGNQPRGIAFDTSGAYAFVANRDTGSVSVIDTAIPTVTTTIPVGSNPMDVASSPCLAKVYVTNYGSNNVSVIDVGTLTVTQVIAGFNNPRSIVISPFGHRAYVSNRSDGTVRVVDTVSDTLIATWNTPASRLSGLDISPDGTTLYAADRDNDAIYAVSVGSGQILATISPGHSQTWEVEAFPEWAGSVAYLSHPDDGSVSVMDISTNTSVGTIPLGGEVKGLALFPPHTTCLSGLVLEPAEATEFGRAGATVIYTETLFNLTGVTDTFGLVAAGNAWTATLSLTSTGAISAGHSVTFTVQVDIPPAAYPGDVDQVTIFASSVGSPTVYSDTAQLTTHVLRPGYIFDAGADEIVVVDTVTHQDTGTAIDTSPYGAFPWNGELSPDGRRLYVSLHGSDRVLVADTASSAAIVSLTVGSGPHGIAFSTDGSYAFVANQWDNTVSVINTGAPAVSITITLGTRPMNIAASPCLSKLYVTTRDDNAISVIDVETLTVTKAITGFNSPWGVVLSPYGDRAYVTEQGSDSIGVIDTASDSLIDTWHLSAQWLAGLDISPDGRRLYVEDANAGVTYVVDTSTGQIVDFIATDPVNDTSWSVEIFPARAGSFAYVSNPWNGDVVVVNIDTNAIVGSIPVASAPRGLALFPPETVCYQHVTAAFTPINSLITVGDTLTFTNLSSGLPAPIYEWSFGDASPVSTATNPTHTYTFSGTFTVVLTASNSVEQDVVTGTVIVGVGIAPTYTLTIEVDGTGSGTVTPTAGTHVYTAGTVITLTATPAPDSEFIGWSGDLNGVTSPITVTMDTDKSVVATFNLLTHTLTITTTGNGSGSVDLNPSGGVYDHGTVVTLTATPDPGSYFGGWTGDLLSADNPETLVMDNDKGITVTFTTEPPIIYTLTVYTVGNGTVEPSGGTYISGTVLSLSATPDPGWYFVRWTGDLTSTTNPITITMTRDLTVTATFNPSGFAVYLPLVIRNY